VAWGLSHGFTFNLPAAQGQGQRFLLHTQTIFIQNVGWESAQGVEIILNYQPDHFALWPQLNYSTATNPEGRFIIKIENLGRREFTTVEMLHSAREMPSTLRVRTNRGECRQLPMAPAQVYPRWFRLLMILIFLIGLFTIFESFVSVIERIPFE
jgi:hypothetical protein